MSDFTPDWPLGHVTRDGRPARIISKDRKGYGQPIVALVENHGKTGDVVMTYGAGGFFAHDGVTENNYDLLNVEGATS